ncbi:hypothetical protein FRC01_009799 [Tulasnella sp. 417]|nr:hypothetical protein FRC01_009799 [Tulasnella sp. 417]
MGQVPSEDDDDSQERSIPGIKSTIAACSNPGQSCISFMVDSDENAGSVVQYAKQILDENLLPLKLADELGLNVNFKDLLLLINSPKNNHATEAGAVVPKVDPRNYLKHHNVQLNAFTTYAAPTNLASGKQKMIETNTALTSTFNYSGHVLTAPLGSRYFYQDSSIAMFPQCLELFAADLWGWTIVLKSLITTSPAFYCKPFAPPPSNAAKHRQWTTDAVFSSSVIAAETLGKSSTSQVVNQQLDDNNEDRAGYTIYENASDYTVQATIGRSTNRLAKEDSYVCYG